MNNWGRWLALALITIGVVGVIAGVICKIRGE